MERLTATELSLVEWAIDYFLFIGKDTYSRKELEALKIARDKLANFTEEQIIE